MPRFRLSVTNVETNEEVIDALFDSPCNNSAAEYVAGKFIDDVQSSGLERIVEAHDDGTFTIGYVERGDN